MRHPVLRTYGVFRVAALLRDARRERHAGAADARVSVWRRARTSRARGQHAEGRCEFNVPCAVWGGAE